MELSGFCLARTIARGRICINSPDIRMTSAARYIAIMRGANLPPLQGETFIEFFPGLKPWAKGYSPFGAHIIPTY